MFLISSPGGFILTFIWRVPAYFRSTQASRNNVLLCPTMHCGTTRYIHYRSYSAAVPAFLFRPSNTTYSRLTRIIFTLLTKEPTGYNRRDDTQSLSMPQFPKGRVHNFWATLTRCFYFAGCLATWERMLFFVCIFWIRKLLFIWH